MLVTVKVGPPTPPGGCWDSGSAAGGFSKFGSTPILANIRGCLWLDGPSAQGTSPAGRRPGSKCCGAGDAASVAGGYSAACRRAATRSERQSSASGSIGVKSRCAIHSGRWNLVMWFSTAQKVT